MLFLKRPFVLVTLTTCRLTFVTPVHISKDKLDVPDGMTTDFIKLAVHHKQKASDKAEAVLLAEKAALSSSTSIKTEGRATSFSSSSVSAGSAASARASSQGTAQQPGSSQNSLDVYAMNPYTPGPGTVIRNLRFGATVKLIQATVLGFIRGSAPFEALKSKLRGEFENTNYVSRFYDNTTVDGKVIVSGALDCRDSVFNDGIRTTNYVTLENCRVNGMIECNGWNTGITSKGPNNIFTSESCQIWNDEETNVRKTILDTFGIFWIIFGVFLVMITCGAIVMTDDTGVVPLNQQPGAVKSEDRLPY